MSQAEFYDKLQDILGTGIPVSMMLADVWVSEGISEELILATVKRIMLGKLRGSINSLKYFDKPVREAHSMRSVKPVSIGSVQEAKPFTGQSDVLYEEAYQEAMKLLPEALLEVPYEERDAARDRVLNNLMIQAEAVRGLRVSYNAMPFLAGGVIDVPAEVRRIVATAKSNGVVLSRCV